ncbi:hypothetical protein HRbin02_01035 [Candidatus Calditenuaceae archaeon HR02]|nr:hypothetical protein HRbin02_01035 [Candidatus Calditenuaceae archaeon HR02]
MTYVDFSKSFRRVRGYLRLYRRRSYNRRYGHATREALGGLTMAVIGRYRLRARDQEDVLKMWLMF